MLIKTLKKKGVNVSAITLFICKSRGWDGFHGNAVTLNIIKLVTISTVSSFLPQPDALLLINNQASLLLKANILFSSTDAG